MPSESVYLLAADFMLVIHVLFVAFVVLGLPAIYMGAWLGWKWVTSFRFRILHLAGIGFVVLETWMGVICPLTTWEMYLREKSGQASYDGSFIQHWLHTLLFYDVPEYVFIGIYTLFGMLVLASWFAVPPRTNKEQ